MIGLLSVVTFLPLAGALVLTLVPRRLDAVLRGGALVVAVATFLSSLPLYAGFDAGTADYQFVEFARWMPSLGVGYHIGIDGISLLLVLLTRSAARSSSSPSCCSRRGCSGCS
jgi:NADH-quinone oxidoreductase subunit M